MQRPRPAESGENQALVQPPGPSETHRALLRRSAPVILFSAVSYWENNLANFPRVSSSASSRRRLFWQLQSGGWLLLVPIATAFASIAFNDWGNIILIGVVRQIFSFFLALGLWRFYRRWPVESFKLGAHVLQIILICLLAAALDATLIETTRRIFRLPATLSPAERGAVPVRFLIYCAWSALYFLIRRELDARDQSLRLAQAEVATREAELATLRAQINPHFLYNALTSILAECDDNPRAVRAITSSLATYLRSSLLQRSHHASLGAEVDAIGAYLRVEQARFEDRLVVTFAIDEAARAAVVPTAVLLPLVENAVKYGLRTSPSPLRITLSATLLDGRVSILVENSGHWLEPSPQATDSTQIGLANLRRRLALLYRADATLAIEHDAGRVRVTVDLPAGETAKHHDLHALQS